MPMNRPAKSQNVSLMIMTCMLLLTGCATENRFIQYCEHAIGTEYQPRRDLLVDTINNPRSANYSIEWNPEYSMLSNGNKEYEHPVLGGDCIVFWEVDPAGIIVGYRYKGEYCKLPPDIL